MMEFHLRDILPFAAGRIINQNNVGGVFELAEYLVGSPVWTENLPRVIRMSRPYVLEQLPSLRDIVFDVPPEAYRWWVCGLAEKHGDLLPLTPLPEDVQDEICRRPSRNPKGA